LSHTSIYFLTDALGSVRDIVRGTDGAVLQSYDYTENGDKTASTALKSDKTWVGGLSVNDDVGDSGLYLMGHRHYDSSLGRFLSRDPIGFAGGMNLYSYGNSPVTTVDPMGWRTLTSSPSQDATEGILKILAGVGVSQIIPGIPDAGDAVGVVLVKEGAQDIGSAVTKAALFRGISAWWNSRGASSPNPSPSPAPGPSPSPEPPCPPTDDPYEEDPKGKLYRHPGGTESTGRLQREADKGYAAYGVPGPSVTTKPMPGWGTDFAVSDKATLTAAGFAVVKTGGSFHYTVHLRSYPVVSADARKRFNIAFGRKP
jgi:RHS repeat-associated protein